MWNMNLNNVSIKIELEAKKFVSNSATTARTRPRRLVINIVQPKTIYSQTSNCYDRWIILLDGSTKGKSIMLDCERTGGAIEQCMPYEKCASMLW